MMHAVRNISLCTKDCLCLYVCPTGATDTETGQIDASKCLSSCRACVDACPSHAISLIPESFPKQQNKNPFVVDSLRSLLDKKVLQMQISEQLSKTAETAELKALADAFAKSNLLMAEDLLRESSYMLPQSEEVLLLLQSMLKQEYPSDFPIQTINKLLELLSKSL